MQITISAPHDWPYEIDRGELVAAARSLGIKRDIDLTITDDLEEAPKEAGPFAQTVGQLDIARSLRKNVIRMTAKQEPVEVLNLGLLHELEHAYQFENLGGPKNIKRAQIVYALGELLFGYERNPIEVQADRVAEHDEAKFHLIRPRSAVATVKGS